MVWEVAPWLPYESASYYAGEERIAWCFLFWVGANTVTAFFTPRYPWCVMKDHHSFSASRNGRSIRDVRGNVPYLALRSLVAWVHDFVY